MRIDMEPDYPSRADLARMLQEIYTNNPAVKIRPIVRHATNRGIAIGVIGTIVSIFLLFGLLSVLAG